MLISGIQSELQPFMQKLILLFLLAAIFSCNPNYFVTPMKQGVWRGELKLSETEILPFNFEVTGKAGMKIFNAEEVILVDDIEYRNDSVFIKMPVFESYFALKNDDTLMHGSFINESLGRVIPFKSRWNVKNRFNTAKDNTKYDVTGNWETTFGNDDKAYPALGIFSQKGNLATGTFRTTTGDYRFLEGVVDGDVLRLSAFDGSHAYLFTAKVSDSTMDGTFYSGNHFKNTFSGKRNTDFELAAADSLTFLKPGFDKLEFSFPDASGKLVSLDDIRFQNKVVIVQIMGSWCPNCLDESRYFSEYYKENRNQDVEFVALAFEYAKTEQLALKSIERLKDGVGINYPILLAQYGSSDKLKAQEKLPMLNQVLSYPTTIFIDKTGKVRKIHTGFNGPATGEKYVEFKKEFEGFLNALLSEDTSIKPNVN